MLCIMVKMNVVVEVWAIRLEQLMGSTSRSHCRIYDVICNSETHRDT
jgi:hypothetical protein